MLISTHEGSFYIVQKYEDSPVCCKNYQNTFRFSKYFKFQLCWNSHWLVVHKMGLLQQRSLYPNLRFWCKTYEWQHSWQEHTLKFWQRNGPHCIPHFSCENNNSSGNQNSSKWFYLVLNPCTVLNPCEPEAKCTIAVTLCLADILCSPLCLNECLWNSTQTKKPNGVPVVFETFSKSICSLQNFWSSVQVHC